MYLYQSEFYCQQNCHLTLPGNEATEKAGGIHLVSSFVILSAPKLSMQAKWLEFTRNTAKEGGGLFLEQIPNYTFYNIIHHFIVTIYQTTQFISTQTMQSMEGQCTWMITQTLLVHVRVHRHIHNLQGLNVSFKYYLATLIYTDHTSIQNTLSF